MSINTLLDMLDVNTRVKIKKLTHDGDTADLRINDDGIYVLNNNILIIKISAQYYSRHRR